MKNICLLLLLLSGLLRAQNNEINYQFSDTYKDRFKYSNLMSISSDGTGGYTLVRAYYQGLILRPRGYIIERYDQNLQLIEEYNYKVDNLQYVDGFIKNGLLNLIFFTYNYDKEQYEYWAHQSAILNLDFRKRPLLSIKAPVVEGALGKNYYNRDFSKGFTTTILFNDSKTGFLISTHYKRKNVDAHLLHLFDADLNKKWTYDFTNKVNNKNYAFEHLALSNNTQEAYVIAKAYYKKKRFEKTERKFAYEVIKVNSVQALTQELGTSSAYPEALYPVLKNNKMLCVGFYANRKDQRYNGLAYFALNLDNLQVLQEKYSEFSTEFMYDKFGREDEKKALNNLVFKSVNVNNDGSILFNAEEYFVTKSMHNTGMGQRMQMERFHYNDIVSAKLDQTGNMLWARNINKTEVTQNDGAYASYSSYIKNGKTYFFICSAADNPQLINNERLVFKQGYGKNRNVFAITLDENGKLTYQKFIDAKEARLPLMVSKPFTNKAEDLMLFYAKRGSKKQLVEVEFTN